MSTITPTTEKQESAWQLLFSSGISRPRKQEDTGIGESRESYGAKAEQPLDCLITALSPNSECVPARCRDIEVIKRVYSSLLEVMEEGVLTESEANALTEFIASKFIEQRFGMILENVFDAQTSRKYSFRAVRGSTK